MKRILTIVFLLVLNFSLKAQILQQPNTYGIGWKRTGADTLLYIPSDTLQVPSWGVGKTHIARKGTTLYYWDGSKWSAISGSGGTYTAGNGLTLSGSQFKLGSPLTENTTITTTGYDFNLPGIPTVSSTTRRKVALIDTVTGKVEKIDASTLNSNIYNTDGTLTGNRRVTIGDGTRLEFDIQPAGGFYILDDVSDTILYANQDDLRLPLIDYTLSTTGKKLLIRDTVTGLVQNIDPALITGATPTLQQVLTAGSTLTTDNTIGGGGNTLNINNLWGLYIETGNGRGIVMDDEDGEPDEVRIYQTVNSANESAVELTESSVVLRTLKDLRENDLSVKNDSIFFRPSFGQMNIDSLRTWSGIADTTYKKPMTWDTRNGRWEYAANWPQQKINLVFGAGSGADSDTTAFTTSAIYGSFYNDADTIVVTSMRSVLQGTSPDVTYKVWYNDSLNVEAGATALVTAGSQVTNTTTGTNVTSFDVTKIPPGVWVWVKTSTVATKPKYFSLTVNGYRK